MELNAERFTHLGSIQALSGKTWDNLLSMASDFWFVTAKKPPALSFPDRRPHARMRRFLSRDRLVAQTATKFAGSVG